MADWDQGPGRDPAGGHAGRSGSDLAELKQYLTAVRSQIGLISAIVLVGTVLAIVIALMLPSQYTAEVQVVLDSRRADVVNVDAVLPSLPADSMAVDTETKVLQSKVLLERVVDRLALTEDAEFNPQLEGPGGFSPGDVLTALRGALRGLAGGGGDGEMSAEFVREEIFKNLREAISVSRVDLTFVIRARCTTLVPRKSERICNALAEEYVRLQLERKLEVTAQADDWLSERVEELRAEVQAKEKEVELFRAENNLINMGGETLAEQQLSDLNEQLALTRADLAEKRARLRQVRGLVQQGNGADSIAEALGSRTISELRTQQGEVARRQAELSTRYGPSHPEMVKVNQELAGISLQIEQEVRRIANNLSTEVSVAEERERSLASSISEQTAGLQGSARALAQLREKERELAAVRKLFEDFLDRLQQVDAQSDLQEADSRILSPAALPTEPSAPRRSLIVLAAAFLSGMMGVGIAVVRDRMDGRVRSGEELERALGGLETLAMIPMLKGVRSPSDYFLRKPMSHYAESFSALLDKLFGGQAMMGSRAYLFTSAVSGEGKSTSAACFALQAARSGRSAVLLDFDLRYPQIAQMFNLKPAYGLTEFLQGEVSYQDILHEEKSTGLHILPLRQSARDPNAVLSSDALRQMLKELRIDYDVIVIDSAPVLPVSDTLKLAPLADGTVFCCRWRSTLAAASQKAVRELRGARAELAGSILTVVDFSKQWRFGSDTMLYSKGGYSKYHKD